MPHSEVPVIHPLRDRLRVHLIDAVVAKGATEADASEAIDDMLVEKPIWDWLANGGWIKLVELIIEILRATGKAP